MYDDLKVADAGIALSIEGQWSRWIRRYSWHLDQVPALLEAMRSDVVRISSDASRYGAERVDSSRAGAPLPFRVEALDAADDLWAALVQYAENVGQVLGEALPDVGRWRVGAEVAGARSTTDVRGGAFALVAWLIERVDAIVRVPELGDTEDFLFLMIRGAAKQYLAPRPAKGRRCRVCLSGVVMVRWTSRGEVARCDNCHNEVRLEVSKPVSEPCADGAHEGCESPDCPCSCHVRTSSLWTPPARREPVPVLPLPASTAACDHRGVPAYVGDDELRHCGECGAVL